MPIPMQKPWLMFERFHGSWEEPQLLEGTFQG